MATAVAKRVAQLRAAHGHSLREVADRTGVSHTTIARIEKGEVTGSFGRTLRQIAEGYGVPLEWLISGRRPTDPESQLTTAAVESGIVPYIPALQALARVRVTPDEANRYVSVLARAVQKGITPQLMSTAVDLLAAR